MNGGSNSRQDGPKRLPEHRAQSTLYPHYLHDCLLSFFTCTRKASSHLVAFVAHGNIERRYIIIIIIIDRLVGLVVSMSD